MIDIMNYLIVFLKRVNNLITKYPLINVFLLAILGAVSLNNENIFYAKIYIALAMVYIAGVSLLGRSSRIGDDFGKLIDNAYNSTIFLVILFSILMYIFVTFYVEFNSIISIDVKVDSWIQFFGSIFGSSLTILALIFTIKMTRQQLDSNYANEIMPVLACENTNRLPKISIKEALELKLINISSNTSINLKIEKIKIEGIYESKTSYLREIDGNSFTLRSNMIKPNDAQLLILDGLSLENEIRDSLHSINIQIEFSFTDIFGKANYSLIYFVVLQLQVNALKVNYKSQAGNILYIMDYQFAYERNSYFKTLV